MKEIKIKRSLLSVYDKTGIVKLAKVLKSHDCEIISTGGTRRKLESAGINVTGIENFTKHPEAFGGRMKTISFNIESSLLFDREKDREEAESLGIKPIDLVVCNFYPFPAKENETNNLDKLIENIDIGGPTMIRAAAKNFKYVSVLCNPDKYLDFSKEIQANAGKISYETRKKLMNRAFDYTADYDALIASTMNKLSKNKTIRMHFSGGKKLRYGENSHQTGRLYSDGKNKYSLMNMQILHGKKISFNNVSDIDSAVESVKQFKVTACAVVKHNNPCGLATGDNTKEVFKSAWYGDSVSAFGSVIAFNKQIDLDTVKFLNLKHKNRLKRKFIEIIIAPDFTDAALNYLKFHKNLRIIKLDPYKIDYDYEYKFFNGILLEQDKDKKLYDKIEVVTQTKNKLANNQKLINFGLKAIKMIKSNAIAIVRKHQNGNQLLGMGAGQPNRIVASQLAIAKARENLKKEYTGKKFAEYYKDEMSKTILISDAFFPFPDNVELAAENNIKTIVQPGGSIRDKKVIKRCNELNLCMVFTGLRHFKH